MTEIDHIVLSMTTLREIVELMEGISWCTGISLRFAFYCWWAPWSWLMSSRQTLIENERKCITGKAKSWIICCNLKSKIMNKKIWIVFQVLDVQIYNLIYITIDLLSWNSCRSRWNIWIYCQLDWTFVSFSVFFCGINISSGPCRILCREK